MNYRINKRKRKTIKKTRCGASKSERFDENAQKTYVSERVLVQHKLLAAGALALLASVITSIATLPVFVYSAAIISMGCILAILLYTPKVYVSKRKRRLYDDN